jgi:hypothetical protein
MMSLHERISQKDVYDVERFDFLTAISHRVIRMDEVHPSVDNDSQYIFMIWVKPNDTEEIRKQIRTNLKTMCSEWRWEVFPNTGDGLIIVSTYL